MREPKPLRTVYIEIGNLCNRSCDFCPGTDRPGQTMDQSIFQRALEGASVLADRAAFHVMGEPLLDPDLAGRLALAARLGVDVMVTTNGTLVDLAAANTRALLAPNVVQVNLSVHALDPDSPADRAAFDRILAFIDQGCRSRPGLYINLRLWNLGPGGGSRSAADFPQKPLLDRLARYLGLALPVPLFPAGRHSRRLSGRLYLHADTVFDWPGTADDQNEGTCRALTDQIAVLADGRVTACCLDRNGELVLGDLHQSTLVEVYNGERAQKMVQGFARGLLVEPLCRRCAYARRFG